VERVVPVSGDRRVLTLDDRTRALIRVTVIPH
jgi:hypothetical protein